MGGASGKATTKAPDFNTAAERTSMGSRPNTSNALGGQTWTNGPGGRQQSSMGFTGPAAQTFADLQTGMGKAASYDPTQARNDAITSNYDQGWSRLQPLQAQQNQAFASGAANSGLDPEMTMFNAGAGLLNRGQNDAQQTLMSGAIGQGNETQRTQMAQMNQPFNQAGLMQSMLNQQGPNMGQGPDYNAAAGSTYGAQKDFTSAQQAELAAMLGGFGNVVGSMGGMGGGGMGNFASKGASASPGFSAPSTVV